MPYFLFGTNWLEPVKALNNVVLPQFGLPASAILIAIFLPPDFQQLEQLKQTIRFDKANLMSLKKVQYLLNLNQLCVGFTQR